MKLADFKVEQWMNDHEMQAKYNLTDTCSKEMSLKELLDLESIDLDMILDYGEITGSQAAKKGILSLYESGNYKQITTCHGCLEANMLEMQTLLEKGDHVITFSPGYQQFMEIPASLGCEVSILPLDAHWQPSLEAVKDALCANTKMVILNNPNKNFVIGLSTVERDRQPSDGGWRWHKWGEYIGNQNPEHEYLYDDIHIDKVYCFHIYEIK